MANTTFDPSLLNQTVTINADADTYADAPIPPEGEYLVVLKGPKKLEDFYTPKFFNGADGKPDQTKFSHVSFKVHGEIVDPGGKWDGTSVFPHVFQTPTTKFNEKVGTTSAMSLVKRCGMGHTIRGGEMTHSEQVEILQSCVAAKPQLRVKLTWRLPGQKKADGSYEADRLVGMANFPKSEDGGYEYQVPADSLNPSGDKITARAEITEWVGI